MIPLRLIRLPDARKHVLRTVLTISGIILGVAVFVAMHLANQALLQAAAPATNGWPRSSKP